MARGYLREALLARDLQLMTSNEQLESCRGPLQC